MSDYQDDVIVLGGGAIGVSAAYYLRKHGYSVTLVERDRVGQACSWGNAGLISPSHFIPLAAPGVIGKGLKWMLDAESPFYIKPRFSWDLWRWLWHFRGACTHRAVRQHAPPLNGLLERSRDLFAELSSDLRTNFGYSEKGVVMLCQTEKALEEEKKAMTVGRELGIDIQLLSQDELNSLEPNLRIDAIGGLFFPRDAHLEPAVFVQSLTQHIREMGVKILENTEAFYFKSSNGGDVTFMTSQGIFSSKKVVVALGSWSPELMESLNIRLPVQPGKGYSITLDDPPIRTQTPFILVDVRVAVTPMLGKLRLAGTMELSGLNLQIRERRVRAMIRNTARYFPDFDPSKIPVVERWTGMRPLSPDGLPFIGAFEGHPNILAATGHSMLGITLAPGTGKLIAEMVDGGPTSVRAEAFQPNRFG